MGRMLSCSSGKRWTCTTGVKAAESSLTQLAAFFLRPTSRYCKDGGDKLLGCSVLHVPVLIRQISADVAVLSLFVQRVYQVRHFCSMCGAALVCCKKPLWSINNHYTTWFCPHSNHSVESLPQLHVHGDAHTQARAYTQARTRRENFLLLLILVITESL